MTSITSPITPISTTSSNTIEIVSDFSKRLHNVFSKYLVEQDYKTHKTRLEKRYGANIPDTEKFKLYYNGIPMYEKYINYIQFKPFEQLSGPQQCLLMGLLREFPNLAPLAEASLAKEINKMDVGFINLLDKIFDQCYRL